MIHEFRPVIGITVGDVAGIGPEVIVKTLSNSKIYDLCRPIVIGNRQALNAVMRFVEPLKLNVIDRVNLGLFEYGTIDLYNVNNIDLTEISIGQLNKKTGKAAVEFLLTAIKLAVSQEVHAITTAPLNKEAINLAGYHYPGHTEILATKTRSRTYAMMLTAGPLKVIHVTTHVALRKACELITKRKVLNTILLAHKALQAFGYKRPKIAVSGLNPHAGEGGLFGREEVDYIHPAVLEAQKKRVRVEGPLPPDTVFLKAKEGHFDIVVAMYHDQGHIPIKLMGFKRGVNVTLGLPIIRTSVDHGTAFDIAGKGIANPDSMFEAVSMAAQLAKKKFGTS